MSSFIGNQPWTTGQEIKFLPGSLIIVPIWRLAREGGVYIWGGRKEWAEVSLLKLQGLRGHPLLMVGWDQTPALAQMSVIFLCNPPDSSHASPTQTCLPLLPRGERWIEWWEFHWEMVEVTGPWVSHNVPSSTPRDVLGRKRVGWRYHSLASVLVQNPTTNTSRGPGCAALPKPPHLLYLLSSSWVEHYFGENIFYHIKL